MSPSDQSDVRKSFMRELHARQPGFRIAVAEDARVTAAHRGERSEFKGGLDTLLQVLRLMWVTDAFSAHVAYRLRARLLARGIPVLPGLLHRFSMRRAQVSIGDPVLLHPGIYIVHGQVVLDGLVEIQPGTVISPWVTIGLAAGNIHGPKVGADAHIGTGAKLIGAIEIGERAVIGANAVVVKDVPAASTAVGIPAKVVGNK
jgi:serine O-acetyltransferase